MHVYSEINYVIKFEMIKYVVKFKLGFKLSIPFPLYFLVWPEVEIICLQLSNDWNTGGLTYPFLEYGSFRFGNKDTMP